MPRKRNTHTNPEVSEITAPNGASAETEKPKRARVRATATATARRTPRKKTEAATQEPLNSASSAITHLAEAVAHNGTGSSEPDTEEIARLAYSYWEARGFQGGSPEEDWLRAESQLRARYLLAVEG